MEVRLRKCCTIYHSVCHFSLNSVFELHSRSVKCKSYLPFPHSFTSSSSFLCLDRDNLTEQLVCSNSFIRTQKGGFLGLGPLCSLSSYIDVTIHQAKCEWSGISSDSIIRFLIRTALLSLGQ